MYIQSCQSMVCESTYVPFPNIWTAQNNVVQVLGKSSSRDFSAITIEYMAHNIFSEFPGHQEFCPVACAFLDLKW